MTNHKYFVGTNHEYLLILSTMPLKSKLHQEFPYLLFGNLKTD